MPPIEAIESWGLGYHLASAVAYVARAGRKGTVEKDVRKAIWYLQRYLRLLEVDS